MPKVRVQQRGESEQCPLCLDRLTDDAQEFTCDCGVRYHRACVEEMGGECVPGCERKLRPPVVEAQPPYFWQSVCPLCLRQLTEDAQEFACACGVSYHQACVEEMGGECVPGCRRKLRSASRSAPLAQPLLASTERLLVERALGVHARRRRRQRVPLAPLPERDADEAPTQQAARQQGARWFFIMLMLVFPFGILGGLLDWWLSGFGARGAALGAVVVLALAFVVGFVRLALEYWRCLG